MATKSVVVVVFCFITRWLFGVTVVLLVVAVVVAVGQVRVRLRAYIWCSSNSSSGGDLDFRFKVLSYKTKSVLTLPITQPILMFFLNRQSDRISRNDNDVICGLFICICTIYLRNISFSDSFVLFICKCVICKPKLERT